MHTHRSGSIIDPMNWLIYAVALPSGLLLFFYLLFKAFSAKGKKVAEELRQRYGNGVKLLTGCGIVSGMNRTQGVLALVHDSIIYRSTVIVQRGEIPLTSIKRFALESTAETSHKRTRKYRGAYVLTLTSSRPDLPLFVVSAKDKIRWEDELRSVLT